MRFPKVMRAGTGNKKFFLYGLKKLDLQEGYGNLKRAMGGGECWSMFVCGLVDLGGEKWLTSSIWNFIT